MVVEDDGIATAVGLADTAETRPDRTDITWSKNRSTGCLVKNLITSVNNLNVLSCPHRAVCIGRCAVAADAWKWDAIKIEDGSGHHFGDQDSQYVTINHGVR